MVQGVGFEPREANAQHLFATLKNYVGSKRQRCVYLQKFRTIMTDNGAGGRIRTYVDLRRRSYNPMPLTTRPPLHMNIIGIPKKAAWIKSFLNFIVKYAIDVP